MFHTKPAFYKFRQCYIISKLTLTKRIYKTDSMHYALLVKVCTATQQHSAVRFHLRDCQWIINISQNSAQASSHQFQD